MINEQDIAFFDLHKIPLDLCYNVNGGKISQSIKAQMEFHNKVFAFNSTPCGSEGHTLRTRAGHCIQCDTSRISYMLRAVSFGTIYIAGTVMGKIIKIGSTKNRTYRKESLNKTRYGGFNDWEILYFAEFNKYGEVEKKIQKTLEIYNFNSPYFHDNHLQDSYELFKCGFSTAYNSLLEVCEKEAIISYNEVKKNDLLHKFEFHNLAKF